MGRHSRGAADGTPPPAPEPPARHPYAPRSVEDTGTWDRSTYRVVDVGLPPDAPVSFPLNGSRPGTQTAGPNRAPARPGPRPDQPAPPHDPNRTRGRDLNGRDLNGDPNRTRGRDLNGGRDRNGTREWDLTGSRTALRAVPEADTALRPPDGPSRYGATRADLAGMTELRYGATREPGAPRYGATRADLVDPAPERRPETPRYGATRADLAESLGATALAPRPEPRTDPDEVTDTGARRARSTFHLATDTDDDEPDQHYSEEPSLLLQWGIFVAQTLTGAVAGLGVWLGFYRLWSTYPFYAVPAVGGAAIGMLVLARTLRRRHGHDLDLMTAIVTIAVATVLTVLPAAFTLQHLA